MRKRRASGEGTVRQRKDGKWEGYTPRNEFGKRRKVVRATQREVLSALAQFKATGKRAEEERGGKQTVAALMAAWFAVKRADLRPKTQDSYARAMRNHLDTAPFAKVRIEKLAADHIEPWYDALRADKPRTARYAKMILAEALDYAVDKHWITENAARSKALRRKQHQSAPHQPLTLEQARRLLEAVSGHRLEALYIVALSLGLRRGEVLALRWEDVNLERATLRVSGTLQRIGTQGLKRGAPKTEASAATLPLPAPVTQALRAHQARQAIERDRLSEIDAWTETGYVFASNRGTPIEPRNLVRQFKNFLSKAGLPETIRFHDLRHSCAMLLIAQGVHPRVVMQYLRHSRIATTMDFYGGAFEDVHAAAAEQLGAALDVGADDERVLELAPKQKP